MTAKPAGNDRGRFDSAIGELWEIGVVSLGPLNSSVERSHEVLRAHVDRRFPGGMGSYLFWTAADSRAFDRDGSLGRTLTLHCSSHEVAATAVALLQRHGVDAAAAPQPGTVAVFPPALAGRTR